MEHLSWNCLALIAIALCSITMAGPVPENTIDELSPVAVEENSASDVDREKRKIFGPDVKLGVKNAVLGYVFSKVDSIIDAKTRLVDQLEATNAAKNVQYGIVAPAPINSLQELFQAVIQPKIAAITGKFGALSGVFAGGFGGSSGFGGAPAGGLAVESDTDGDTDTSDLDAAPVVASGGSGNILGSILKLSGPILSSSSASGKGGAQIPIEDSGDE